MQVVAVTGSIGKTSTKLAIASVLSQGFNVRYQKGNYNHPVTVPLIFFGQQEPSLFNPFAWLVIFIKNEIKIRKRFPYEVVVVELGTDGPGQIAEFKNFLRVDIGLVTAITPEHMEFFADLDAVAAEELYLGKLSRQLLINSDLADAKYLKGLDAETYGIKQPANFRLTSVKFDGDEASFDLHAQGHDSLHSGHQKITEPQLYSICAAAAVGYLLKMSPKQIDEGIRNIPPVSGRMQHLEGAAGSGIIDDTYNASPVAMLAALDTLYRLSAKKKIAILGNMNELGHFSAEEHKAIGEYCDPRQLKLVVTIGPDANAYLATAAKAKGCQVQTFNDPYSAGQYLRPLLDEDTIVLAKGSQNKVFAEEAVKLLLANPDDAVKLVRQSPKWLKTKRRNFSVKM